MDLQFFGTFSHDGRAAAGYEPHQSAFASPDRDSQTVAGVESLDFVSLLVENERAIGHAAVNIGKDHANFLKFGFQIHRFFSSVDF